jgi:hypothetical protein
VTKASLVVTGTSFDYLTHQKHSLTPRTQIQTRSRMSRIKTRCLCVGLAC